MNIRSVLSKPCCRLVPGGRLPCSYRKKESAWTTRLPSTVRVCLPSSKGASRLKLVPEETELDPVGAYPACATATQVNVAWKPTFATASVGTVLPAETLEAAQENLSPLWQL